MSARSDTVQRINALLAVIHTWSTPTWRTSFFLGPDLPKLPGEDACLKDWAAFIPSAVDSGLIMSGAEGEAERFSHAMHYWWQQPLVVRAAAIELVEMLKREVSSRGSLDEIVRLRRSLKQVGP